MYVSSTLKAGPTARKGVSPTPLLEYHTKQITEDSSPTFQLHGRNEKHGSQLPRSKLSRPKRAQGSERDGAGAGPGVGRPLSSDLLIASVERLSISSSQSADHRNTPSDRLNIARRQLTCCPALDGGERLRLLNLQHNSIARLDNLSSLTRLVFLDLYDNRIAEISGLDELASLRVLMLGKNRIKKISGLERLVHLDVLDLHGNFIKAVENLSHLCYLRVLNLAGNELTSVSQFEGLHALVELNLRRNKISYVSGIEMLSSLQRLFLSYNLIKRWEDVACISNCCTLQELALEGNPLAASVDYRPVLLSRVQQLNVLDQKAITEEEWVVAASNSHGVGTSSDLKERNERVIRRIKELWKGSNHDDLNVYELPTYLVDFDVGSATLSLYGTEALEAFECTTDVYQGVTRLFICCVRFEDMMSHLPKMAAVLPNMTALVLECTNMARLEHIDALAELGVTRLASLVVSPIGNPITKHPHFLHYCLYRLQHFGLQEVNGCAVTSEDRAAVAELFGSLSCLVSTVPPTHVALIRNTNRSYGRPPSAESTRLDSNMQVWLPGTTIATDDNIQRAAIQFTNEVISSVLTARAKAEEMSQLWPAILSDLVHQTIQEYKSIDEQMAAMLDDL